MQRNNQTYYQRLVMREIIIIISVTIIGGCVLWYYIGSHMKNKSSEELESTDVVIENQVANSNTSSVKETQLPNLEISETSNSSSDEVVSEVNSPTEVTYPTINELNVTPLSYSELSIDALGQNPLTIGNAEIQFFDGNITSDNQEDIYSFVAPYTGRYRADLSNVQYGTALELYIYNSLGEKVSYDSYCGNEEGITAKDLIAGETYTVKVGQENGYTSYRLTLAMQKAPVDITGYTQISDSIVFTDQRNVYYFTPATTGRYRFDITGLFAGTDVQLYVFNKLGETVSYDTYIKNGEGITVKDMQAGETYEVQVRQDYDFGTYTLNIGYQKSMTDITEYTTVNDSIEYEDQRNVYSFTVPVTGRFRFDVTDMMNDCSVELYVFNQLGETVGYDTYITNEEGFTLKDLQAGETYEIQIRYSYGFSDYSLQIGKQKNTEVIDEDSVIHDSVEYTDQRNVYSFTRSSNSEICLNISGLEANTAVELYVFSDLDETVAYDTYCYNGESIYIDEGSLGDHFEVQVRQCEGYGDYVLTLSK